MPTSPETPEQMAQLLEGIEDTMAAYADAGGVAEFVVTDRRRQSLLDGAAALRAQGRETGQWQAIDSAPKHTPLLFLFDEGDGNYFQEVGQRLNDAPNGGRMRFAEANMNPGSEPEETTRPSFWMPLPSPPVTQK